MRRPLCRPAIFVVGIAVVLALAGCGGSDGPEASSSTHPAVDSNVAFKEYEKAERPYECSDAYGDMGDAHRNGDLALMQGKAREYRDQLATFAAQLGKIAFPDAAQPIVGGMQQLVADELARLNELASVDLEDTERIAVVRSEAEATDAAVMVENDRLRAALGHPESAFGYAADQLASADAAFYKEALSVNAKFGAAIAANDLAGAKAANAVEIEALQRYIGTLGTIDWPPGSFEGQANTLADHLREQIEFDRRQTDVATAAQIVRAPEEGTPAWNAARKTYDALWRVLVQTHLTARPASKC